MVFPWFSHGFPYEMEELTLQDLEHWPALPQLLVTAATKATAQSLGRWNDVMI